MYIYCTLNSAGHRSYWIYRDSATELHLALHSKLKGDLRYSIIYHWAVNGAKFLVLDFQNRRSSSSLSSLILCHWLRGFTVSLLLMQLLTLVITPKFCQISSKMYWKHTESGKTPEVVSRAHDFRVWLEKITHTVVSFAQNVVGRSKPYACNLRKVHECSSSSIGAWASEDIGFRRDCILRVSSRSTRADVHKKPSGKAWQKEFSGDCCTRIPQHVAHENTAVWYLRFHYFSLVLPSRNAASNYPLCSI